MQIVLYTCEGYEESELFRYIHACVCARFGGRVVAMRALADHPWRRRWRKIGRLGFWKSLEILSSYPAEVWIGRQDARQMRRLLRELARPAAPLEPAETVWVDSLNGPDAVRAITALQPDVILQAGAGILRRPVFSLARLGTLNLHHGIAPLIKGMNSLYWGLWERKPEWVGCTVHYIDDGIDTGGVLAYAPVAAEPGEGVPSLLARATQAGVGQLLNVLERLERGERWTVPPPPGEHVYRSTMSGWRLMALRHRLVRERRKAAAGRAGSDARTPSA